MFHVTHYPSLWNRQIQRQIKANRTKYLTLFGDGFSLIFPRVSFSLGRSLWLIHIRYKLRSSVVCACGHASVESEGYFHIHITTNSFYPVHFVLSVSMITNRLRKLYTLSSTNGKQFLCHTQKNFKNDAKWGRTK